MAFIQVVNLRLDDGSVVEAFVSSDGIARLQAGRIEAVETLPAPEPIEQPPQALSEEEQREWWGDHMRRQTDLFRRQGLIR